MSFFDPVWYRYAYVNQHEDIRQFLMNDEGFLKDKGSLDYKIEDLRRRREVPAMPRFLYKIQAL